MNQVRKKSIIAAALLALLTMSVGCELYGTDATIARTGTVARILTAMGASNDGSGTAALGIATMIATIGAMIAPAILDIGTVSIGKLFSAAECIDAGRGIAASRVFVFWTETSSL